MWKPRRLLSWQRLVQRCSTVPAQGQEKSCKKKALAKAKEATKEALAKTQETEPEAKEAEEATNVTEDLMKAGFQADLAKATKAMEDAKGTMTTAVSKMFTFY
jgi:hypothetical protein